MVLFLPRNLHGEFSQNFRNFVLEHNYNFITLTSKIGVLGFSYLFFFNYFICIDNDTSTARKNVVEQFLSTYTTLFIKCPNFAYHHNKDALVTKVESGKLAFSVNTNTEIGSKFKQQLLTFDVVILQINLLTFNWLISHVCEPYRILSIYSLNKKIFFFSNSNPTPKLREKGRKKLPNTVPKNMTKKREKKLL